jgi:MYXO-CTERM domain-containing protein
MAIRQVTETEGGGVRVVPARGSAAYWLSSVLAMVAIVSAGLTLGLRGILTGPAAMNGSARGTALVVGVVAVPLMVAAMIRTARGPVRALVVWLGAAAYLLYNAQLFLYATPFNELFLLYVAMLSLSIWSIGAVLHGTNVTALARRFSPDLPVRGIAVYAWVIVGLNLLAWLRGIVPAILDDEPTAFLADSGLTTSPVYVQDLALWLPLMAVAAAWMWRRRPWGYLITGATLTMWVVEAVSVAVDQAFGHAADPESSLAAPGMVWMFAALAVVGLVPLCFYFRGTADR